MINLNQFPVFALSRDDKLCADGSRRPMFLLSMLTFSIIDTIIKPLGGVCLYIYISPHGSTFALISLIVGAFLYALSFIGKKKREEEKKAWEKYYQEKKAKAEAQRRADEEFDAWVKNRR